MNITEIYNMKINMGLLDLQKYIGLVNSIENIPVKYKIDLELEQIASEIKEELKLENEIDLDQVVEIYSNLVFGLHSKLGNTLNELEFKLNQAKIQARLKSLKNPEDGKLDLNLKNDFSNLTPECISLLELSYKLVKFMNRAMRINILSVVDKQSIEELTDSINKLKQEIDVL
ncbi:hypothetical protein [Intestinibacter sp.]